MFFFSSTNVTLTTGSVILRAVSSRQRRCAFNGAHTNEQQRSTRVSSSCSSSSQDSILLSSTGSLQQWLLAPLNYSTNCTNFAVIECVEESDQNNIKVCIEQCPCPCQSPIALDSRLAEFLLLVVPCSLLSSGLMSRTRTRCLLFPFQATSRLREGDTSYCTYTAEARRRTWRRTWRQARLYNALGYSARQQPLCPLWSLIFYQSPASVMICSSAQAQHRRAYTSAMLCYGNVLSINEGCLIHARPYHGRRQVIRQASTASFSPVKKILYTYTVLSLYSACVCVCVDRGRKYNTVNAHI